MIWVTNLKLNDHEAFTFSCGAKSIGNDALPASRGAAPPARDPFGYFHTAHPGSFRGGNYLNAQTPLARFVLPTNTTSTAVQPTFEIVTSLPIDTTSVHWNLEMIDTPNDYQYPTICILLDRDTSKGDTVWPFMALPGTGTIVNDTTIEFQPVSLGTSQPCEAVLMGLRVIDPATGDTITISDTVARITFISIAPPPSFVDFSAFDSDYSCKMHDTLTATFSQKLDSASSSSGPIVSIAIPNIAVSGDSLSETDSAISCTAWVDPADSTKIHIVPNDAFVPAQMYRVAIKLSGLTGDTTQDFAEGFVCQKSWRLNIVAAPTDGLTCMPVIHFWPTINENYVVQYDSTFDSTTMTETYDTTAILDTNDVGKELNAGDTATYTAPSQVAGAVFKQWSGSGNPGIDTSRNPVLTVTETADQLHSMNIVALYGPVAIDTICVATAGANTPAVNSDFIEIRSDSQDCNRSPILDTFGVVSTSSYPIERGKTVTLYAYTTSDTIQFDHWSSADSNINGNPSPVIKVSTNGNVCATANFLPLIPGGLGHLKVFIQNLNIDDPTMVNDIATLQYFPGPEILSRRLESEWDAMSTYCPVPVGVTIKILNPDYGVVAYSIYGPSPSTTDFGYQVGMGDLGSPNPEICGWDGCTYTVGEENGDQTDITYPRTTYVILYVVKLNVTLTLNIAMDDGTIPPSSVLFNPPPYSNAQGVWVYDNQNPLSEVTTDAEQICGSASGHTQFPLNNTLGYLLSYPINSSNPVTLSLTAGGATCYNFDYWGQGCPSEVNPSLNTTNPFTGIVMDKDKTATAVFHSPFVLQSISFYQWQGRMQDATIIDPSTGKAPANNPQQDPGGGDPSGGPVWQTFPASGWGTTAYKFGLWGGSGTTWTQGTPATIDLKFSKPVDPNNFKGCRLAEQTGEYGQLVPHNFQFMIGKNASIDSYDGRIVHLTLTDAGSQSVATWKGQIIVLHVDDDGVDPILDNRGEHLSHCNGAPDEFYIRTENPDIQWYYTNTHVWSVYDNQWWDICDHDGSVVTYWMASMFYYHGAHVYEARSTAVIDGIDDNIDVNSQDIGWSCSGDDDGDKGHEEVDDAAPGTRENQIMVDCPHVWNHSIAAGAVNRLDADDCFTDYGECAPVPGSYGQMWFQILGDYNWTSPGYINFWGVAEALNDMAANPSHYSKPAGFSSGTATAFGQLPCTTWKEDDPNWSSFGKVIVQPYTEPWVNYWENSQNPNIDTYVPPDDRHINCVANFPQAQPRWPDWWGAGTQGPPSNPGKYSAYPGAWQQNDAGGGSRIDIQVTIK